MDSAKFLAAALEWEEKKVTQSEEEQVGISMKLWIARESDKSLYLFSKKPIFEKGCWIENSGYGYCFAELPYDVFPEVTFENSPQEVELKSVQ